MLKDKALASLAAGDLLLERGFPDDAASRYDYAMYRAAVHALTRRGFRPERVRSGAVDWDHSMVENNVAVCRRDGRDRLLYAAMRRLRGQADYGDGAIDRWKLDERRADIRDFVRELTK